MPLHQILTVFCMGYLPPGFARIMNVNEIFSNFATKSTGATCVPPGNNNFKIIFKTPA